MLMDDVLERFIAHSPMAVAVRGAFEYALSPTPLDDLFVRTVGHPDDLADGTGRGRVGGAAGAAHVGPPDPGRGRDH